MRPSYRDEAFVLRTYKLGEADKILVLLTRDHGIVRAVAKGVRKTRSRFGARLDHFCHIAVQLYPGKNLDTITEVFTIHSYASAISQDPDRYVAAMAILEIATHVSPTSEEDTFNLLDQALGWIATDYEIAPYILADRFAIQALEQAGWGPSLVDCAQCGSPGPHHAFHPQSGGAVCSYCRPTGSMQPEAGVVRALWWLSHDRMSAVQEAYRSNPSIFDHAHRLLTILVQNHVEHPCRAFENCASTELILG